MIRQHRLKIVGIVIMVAATGILMYLYGEATKGQRQQRAIAEQIIRLLKADGFEFVTVDEVLFD